MREHSSDRRCCQGSLARRPPSGIPGRAADDIEVWRLKNPRDGSSGLASAPSADDGEARLRDRRPDVCVPTVTPHHVCVVAAPSTTSARTGRRSRCPTAAGASFVPPPEPARRSHVTIIDTGYIAGNPAFDAGATSASAPGSGIDSGSRSRLWIDRSRTSWTPTVTACSTAWRATERSSPASSPRAAPTRTSRSSATATSPAAGPNPPPPDDQSMLFTSEMAIAALAADAEPDADVISVRFAFPTLDAIYSPVLASRCRSRARGRPAIVAPAGNESTTCPYWPAAHPRVIGVGADRRGGARRRPSSRTGAHGWTAGRAARTCSRRSCASRASRRSSRCRRARAPLKFEGWATLERHVVRRAARWRPRSSTRSPARVRPSTPVDAANTSWPAPDRTPRPPRWPAPTASSARTSTWGDRPAPYRCSSLLTAAADGDQTAWETIVSRYSGLVWATARAHRLSGADAADVAQTTWLRLVENLDRIRDPDGLGAWLATTARRECLRLIRLQGRAQPSDDLERLIDPDDRGLDTALLTRERDSALWAAFTVAERASASSSCGSSRRRSSPATRRSAPRWTCRSAPSARRGRAAWRSCARSCRPRRWAHERRDPPARGRGAGRRAARPRRARRSRFRPS